MRAVHPATLRFLVRTHPLSSYYRHMTLVRRLAFLTTLPLLALTTVRAEIAPDGYRKLQAEAPEALVIEVKEVSTKWSMNLEGKTTEVTAQAKVRTVRRSAAGLKPEQSIVIRYTVFDRIVPMPGPRQPAVLREGSVIPAYLRPLPEGGYGPAAYGMSFSEL